MQASGVRGRHNVGDDRSARPIQRFPVSSPPESWQGAKQAPGQLLERNLCRRIAGFSAPQVCEPGQPGILHERECRGRIDIRAITRIGCINHDEKRNLMAGRPKLRGDFVRKDSSQAHSSNHKGARRVESARFSSPCSERWLVLKATVPMLQDPPKSSGSRRNHIRRRLPSRDFRAHNESRR